MKKNILNNRKLIYFLTMLIAVLMVTTYSANGNYVTNIVLEDKMVENVNIDNVIETQPSDVVEPDVVEFNVVEPDVVEFNVAEPDVVEPKVVEPEIVEPDVISIIDDLINKIIQTPEDCWRKPAQNRKDTMINKLTSLKELILQDYLEEAYNKTLHDIKPKLTALKTDENEEPWGNGTFKQAWLVCEDLREEFRVDCNTILNELIPPELM